MQFRGDSKEIIQDYAPNALSLGQLATAKSWTISSHYGKAGLRAIQTVNGYAVHTIVRKLRGKPTRERIGADRGVGKSLKRLLEVNRMPTHLDVISNF